MDILGYLQNQTERHLATARLIDVRDAEVEKVRLQRLKAEAELALCREENEKNVAASIDLAIQEDTVDRDLRMTLELAKQAEQQATALQALLGEEQAGMDVAVSGFAEASARQHVDIARCEEESRGGFPTETAALDQEISDLEALLVLNAEMQEAREQKAQVEAELARETADLSDCEREVKQHMKELLEEAGERTVRTRRRISALETDVDEAQARATQLTSQKALTNAVGSPSLLAPVVPQSPPASYASHSPRGGGSLLPPAKRVSGGGVVIAPSPLYKTPSADPAQFSSSFVPASTLCQSPVSANAPLGAAAQNGDVRVVTSLLPKRPSQFKLF